MSGVPPVLVAKSGCCCFGLKTAHSYQRLAAICLVWAIRLDCHEQVLLPVANAITHSILHAAASLLLCCIHLVQRAASCRPGCRGL